MAIIELSNSEIEEIINGLDIAKCECNRYDNIFKKFKEKFQNDLNMLFVYEDGDYKISNNAYQLIGIQKQIMNKKEACPAFVGQAFNICRLLTLS